MPQLNSRTWSAKNNINILFIRIYIIALNWNNIIKFYFSLKHNKIFEISNNLCQKILNFPKMSPLVGHTNAIIIHNFLCIIKCVIINNVCTHIHYICLYVDHNVHSTTKCWSVCLYTQLCKYECVCTKVANLFDDKNCLR